MPFERYELYLGFRKHYHFWIEKGRTEKHQMFLLFASLGQFGCFLSLDTLKKLIGYIKQVEKTMTKSLNAKWFLLNPKPYWTKPNAGGWRAAAVKAGEKIHTMGYNEIMVQVGGETTNSLGRFGRFLEVKNISENAKVCHATCWWWRHPKQPTNVWM